MEVLELCYTFSRDDEKLNNYFLEFEKTVETILNDERTWNSYLISSDNEYENPLFSVNNESSGRIPIKMKLCKKGHRNHKCRGIRVNNNKIVVINEPHIVFTLATTDYINNKGCPSLENDQEFVTPLSCTVSSPHFIKIFINFENWQNGFKYALSQEGIKCTMESKGKMSCIGKKETYNNYFMFLSNPELSVSLYRIYIINHELGHALNRDHYNAKRNAKNSNKLLPVMVQQTKGFYGYKINVWPLPEE